MEGLEPAQARDPLDPWGPPGVQGVPPRTGGDPDLPGAVLGGLPGRAVFEGPRDPHFGGSGAYLGDPWK